MVILCQPRVHLVTVLQYTLDTLWRPTTIWSAFCEFKVWLMFYTCCCCAIHNIFCNELFIMTLHLTLMKNLYCWIEVLKVFMLQLITDITHRVTHLPTLRKYNAHLVIFTWKMQFFQGGRIGHPACITSIHTSMGTGNTIIPYSDSDSDSDNVYSTKIDTDTISGLQKT